MHFQSEFYVHIICGDAGQAASIMARLALNLGHDAQAFPFAMNDLRMVGNFERRQGTQGLNEFYAMECARAAMLQNFKPWTTDQLEKLIAISQEPPIPSLDERFPLRQT